MLKQIRIIDFKSFADEEVALAPLTLLVGANASGKSNFLDALWFLHGLPLGAGRASSERAVRRSVSGRARSEARARRRTKMGDASAGLEVASVLDVCPELATLKQRIASWLSDQTTSK